MGFESEIIRKLRDIEIGSPLPGILVRPIVMDPEVATPFKDFVTLQKDGEVHVGLNIDYGLWVSASWSKKIDMFAENIFTSVDKIKEVHLSSEDRVKLLDIVDQARQILQKKGESR